MCNQERATQIINLHFIITMSAGINHLQFQGRPLRNTLPGEVNRKTSLAES